MIKVRYRLITIISLVYIFVPSILFCAGWLKLYFSIPVILLIFSGICRCFRKDETENLKEGEFFTASFITVSVVIGLVFVVVFLSGVGGYTKWQSDDYYKHNAFLKDLIEYDWPLGYSELGPQKEPHVLVTYIGYYLPSALVGKICGHKIANHFSFLWVNIGVLLTVIWFYRIIGKATFFLALFFLFFSGLDVIGYTIRNGWHEMVSSIQYLDMWLKPLGFNAVEKVFWIFPSNICMLTVGPHHIIPSWLIILMVIYYGFIRETSYNLLFLSSACVIGSAFVSIGLLPYVLIAIIFNKAKSLFTFQNMITGPIVVSLVGLFILSNEGNFPHGWIWEFHDMWECWPTLALFYFVEFGLYFLVCPKIDEDNCHIPYKLLKWSCITLLLFCPWYLVGYFSDFTTKTSIPSLLVLAVCIATSIIKAKGEKQLQMAGIIKVLLIIGAFSGLFQMSKSLACGAHFYGNNLKNARHIDEFAEDKWWLAQQLFADPNGSIFWDYIAAEPSIN